MFTPSDLRPCGGGDRIRTGDFYDAKVIGAISAHGR
jgi:hypothetical protein